MIWNRPEIKSIPMWSVSAPINSTLANQATGICAVVTVAASTAQTVTLPTYGSSIEIIPVDIPSTPIFIEWWFGSQTPASATVFDEVLTPCKPTCQVWAETTLTTFSIFSTTATTVYIIIR